MQRKRKREDLLMLIRTRVYLICLMLAAFSLLLLARTITNKNAAHCKYLSLLGLFGMAFLFTDLIIVPSFLAVPVGLDFLYYCFLGLLSGFFCFASIVINLAKRIELPKSPYGNKDPMPKYFKAAVLLLLILPVIMLSARILRDWIFISKSDLIVVIRSRGNGGIGDSDVLAFAITDNSCKQFDLFIDYGLKDVLSEDYVDLGNSGRFLETGPYQVAADTSRFTIVHQDAAIYIYDHKNHSPFAGDYFNFDIRECYYKKR